MQKLFTVVPLQRKAPTPGDDEGDHGQDEERDPTEPRDLVDRQMELRADQVVAAGRPENAVRGDTGRTEACAGRMVARTIQ